MTPTSIPTKSGLCVWIVPALGGTGCCLASDPASPSAKISGANLPSSITTPPTVLYQSVFVVSPAKAEPFLFACEAKAYMISVSPCGPGLRIEACGVFIAIDSPAAVQHEHGDGQDLQRRVLHLGGPDLLADVLRSPPDHQPSDEDGHDGEDEDAVQAGADPAGGDLAERDVEQGDPATQRGERVMERGHQAGRGDGGRRGEQRGPRRAEDDVLAFCRAVRQVRLEGRRPVPRRS